MKVFMVDRKTGKKVEVSDWELSELEKVFTEVASCLDADDELYLETE